MRKAFSIIAGYCLKLHNHKKQRNKILILLCVYTINSRKNRSTCKKIDKIIEKITVVCCQDLSRSLQKAVKNFDNGIIITALTSLS